MVLSQSPQVMIDSVIKVLLARHWSPFKRSRCYALYLGCLTTYTGAAPQCLRDGSSVAAGDDFEVFGVDGQCVVLVAVVVFGQSNKLVAK